MSIARSFGYVALLACLFAAPAQAQEVKAGDS